MPHKITVILTDPTAATEVGQYFNDLLAAVRGPGMNTPDIELIVNPSLGEYMEDMDETPN